MGMKKLFLYFFTFSVVFSLVETPVLGQGLLKGARGVSRASENAARRAGNAAGNLPTAARRLPVPAVRPAVPVVPATHLERLIDTHKRPLFKLQRMLGVSPHKAAANLHQWGAQPTRYVRPVLSPELTFTVQDFSEVIPPVTSTQDLPPLPFIKKPAYIFRGMGLGVDGDAIRNILTNGLRTANVSTENATLLLSTSGGQNYYAAAHAVQHPRINLTNNPSAAVYYAHRYAKLGLATVVVVKSSAVTETGEIIATEQDIPAEDIVSFVALLSVDGEATWCQIELAENGFKVTPFKFK